jgi:F-type H+-transporting ATPase subunit epsilon
MLCIVVTPERTVLSHHASFIVMPLVDGEYGVQPNHAPLIARLGAGELRMTGMDGKIMNYYVEGGFAEVLDDTIVLMTMYAIPADTLDLAQTEKELKEAEAMVADTWPLRKLQIANIHCCTAKVKIAQKMAEKSPGR